MKGDPLILISEPVSIVSLRIAGELPLKLNIIAPALSVPFICAFVFEFIIYLGGFWHKSSIGLFGSLGILIGLNLVGVDWLRKQEKYSNEKPQNISRGLNITLRGIGLIVALFGGIIVAGLAVGIVSSIVMTLSSLLGTPDSGGEGLVLLLTVTAGPLVWLNCCVAGVFIPEIMRRFRRIGQ